MKMHNFHLSPLPGGRAETKAPFAMQGLSFEDFRKIHGGEFCELPENWSRCHPGFEPYRLGDGTIVGVAPDAP